QEERQGHADADVVLETPDPFAFSDEVVKIRLRGHPLALLLVSEKLVYLCFDDLTPAAMLPPRHLEYFVFRPVTRAMRLPCQRRKWRDWLALVEQFYVDAVIAKLGELRWA